MVIDSSERERIDTVKDELNTLLSHEVSYLMASNRLILAPRAS